MSYGLEILRDDGNIQLSSEYSHYKLIKKVNLDSNGVFYDKSGITYSDNVIVAMSPTSSTPVELGNYPYLKNKIVSYLAFAKGSWEYFDGQIVSETSYPMLIPVSNNGSLAIKGFPKGVAYIFDTFENTTISDYGLTVYNSSGKVIFTTSNNSNFMSAEKYTNGSITNSYWGNGTIPNNLLISTYSISKPWENVAIVPFNQLFYYNVGIEVESYFYSVYVWDNSKLLLGFKDGLSFISRGFSGNYYQNRYSFLTVDVSTL